MSNLYPKLASLDAQRRSIYEDIQGELKAAFLNQRVRVNHHRGSYTGVVVRIGWRTCSVIVRNDATGKTTERYPLSHNIHGTPEVELLAGGEA